MPLPIYSAVPDIAPGPSSANFDSQQEHAVQSAAALSDLQRLGRLISRSPISSNLAQ